jgi:hypothetical protein
MVARLPAGDRVPQSDEALRLAVDLRGLALFDSEGRALPRASDG